MQYVVFVGIMLCIASMLMYLQYARKPRGTSAHAARGWAILISAAVALCSIEYAVFAKRLNIESNTPLFIVHMAFAIPVLMFLVFGVVSGAVAYWALKRIEISGQHESLHSRFIHANATRELWWLWIAAIITGSLFFITSYTG